MQTIQRFFYWVSKQKLVGKIAIGCVSMLVLCCFCIIPVAILTLSTPTSLSNSSSVDNELSAISTKTLKPIDFTKTPAPTKTPLATNTPAPTKTPTPIPAGSTRDNPVPAGTSINIGGNMTLTILGAIRPADSIVINANMFNTKPESNQEYVQVDIQVICNKPSNEKCYFATSTIKAVGADGIIYDAEIFIAGVEGLLESGEFFGGATRTGKMFFIVPKDDKNVVLFYDPILFGNIIYFALP